MPETRRRGKWRNLIIASALRRFRQMSTPAEIQEAIHKLSPAEQAELRQSLLEEETAAMMSAIAEGAQRIDAVASGEVRWLTEAEFRSAVK